ncbi:MAG: hypothetical protein ACI4VQ_03760 [Clostridia bacterium]
MKKSKNHKIKYSEQDYIEKNYIKDGKAVIPIKIKKLDDLYMKHDYLKLDLSDEVFDYIEEIAYLIPRNTDIVLEIHYNDEISENKQDRIRKVFKSNYGSDIDDIDYDIRHHNYKAIAFFLVGTIFIFLSFLFRNATSYIANFVTEFFVITGWVFIWEMVETVSIKRSELISKRLNKLQLYDAEITFIFDD